MKIDASKKNVMLHILWEGVVAFESPLWKLIIWMSVMFEGLLFKMGMSTTWNELHFDDLS